MWVRRLAAAAAFLTVILIVAGGLVTNTDSGLACPDWPTCFGSPMPHMAGGVAVEHTHRLIATALGLCTVGLCIGTLPRRLWLLLCGVFAPLLLGSAFVAARLQQRDGALPVVPTLLVLGGFAGGTWAFPPARGAGRLSLLALALVMAHGLLRGPGARRRADRAGHPDHPDFKGSPAGHRAPPGGGGPPRRPGLAAGADPSRRGAAARARGAGGAGMTTAAMRDYVELAKPRITTLVVFTCASGLWLAPGRLPARTVLLTLVGTVLIVAAANLLNMYLERDRDALMKRTMNRPLPAGRMDPQLALRFGLALAAVSVPLLTFAVGPLPGLLASVALVSYVLLYTPLKRYTAAALLVGAVPGAIPPLIGWTAATERLRLPRALLFPVLFLWHGAPFPALPP